MQKFQKIAKNCKNDTRGLKAIEQRKSEKCFPLVTKKLYKNSLRKALCSSNFLSKFLRDHSLFTYFLLAKFLIHRFFGTNFESLVVSNKA